MLMMVVWPGARFRLEGLAPRKKFTLKALKAQRMVSPGATAVSQPPAGVKVLSLRMPLEERKLGQFGRMVGMIRGKGVALLVGGSWA
jgi:hypothetical protein